MMVRNNWLKGTVVLGSILFLLLGCSVVQDSNLFPVASVASNIPSAVEARLQSQPQVPPQQRPPLLKDNAACLDEDGIPIFDVPNLSANCPDLFAWLKFIEINAPAPDNPDLALWQTWATDPNTFPEKPQPSECSDPDSDDPEQCPIWPDPSVVEAEVLLASKRNPDLHPPERAEAILAAAEEGAGVPSDLGHISLETIRRNRASFNYIVENELWYQEGLAQRFNENFKIEFPMDAIEIKLNWLPMKYVSDPSRYFTAEVAGELQGVVAMHVTTKDLPNWFWATFEHVDNPGRCDFIGCRDSFGLDPAYIAPRDKLKTTYPPGDLDPILIEIMEIEELDPVFQYYRLKGSQIDFTDSMGEPTLLGNSVTEYGFVPTASCITCHGRAGVDWNGKKPANLRVFGEKLGGQTFNGPLDPELFYNPNNPALRYMMQVDFVWAIPFRAQPIGGAKSSE